MTFNDMVQAVRKGGYTGRSFEDNDFWSWGKSPEEVADNLEHLLDRIKTSDGMTFNTKEELRQWLIPSFKDISLTFTQSLYIDGTECWWHEDRKYRH